MSRLIFKNCYVKLVVILVLISLTSCLSTRTLPTNRINDLPSKRMILKIQTEDTSWIINNYKVNGRLITGNLVRDTKKIPELKKADVYIASRNAVKIEGEVLTIPVENIGKVDYKVPDILLIVSSIGITGVLLLFSPILFY